MDCAGIEVANFDEGEGSKLQTSMMGDDDGAANFDDGV
jgi:hypothetical protein